MSKCAPTQVSATSVEVPPSPVEIPPVDTTVKLLVDESSSEDDSAVAMSQNHLDALGLFAGDHVLLRGKKRKFTVGSVVVDNSLGDGKVRLSKVSRSNLRYEA